MKVIKRTRKQVIKLWIKALRSGEYKQTTQSLRDSKGFCCLGVLCDLARKDGGDKWEKDWSGYLYNDSQGDLPSSMHSFIFTPEAKISPADLVHMNDTFNKSFKEIADVIEQKLL